MSPPSDAPSGTPDEASTQQFLATLRSYHEKRGTNFDPSPRVGTRNINLLKLFNIVVKRGGYDVVSDEKLLWRKLCNEFDVGSANAPALAFQLKTIYYKFLSAYEISTVHKREPPPPEILEYTTAKGSGLLTRTVDNYRPSARRETTNLGNDSEASGDDGTPMRERNGSEEAPGSGSRTRGLRQAPPQRVLFQPETQTSRQHRNTSTPSHQPSNQHHNQLQPQHQHHQAQHQQQHRQHTPHGASTFYTPSSNVEHMSMAVTNYEPRPQMPLTLRPVITPGNNPAEFARRQRAQAQNSTNSKPASSMQRLMLPGSM